MASYFVLKNFILCVCLSLKCQYILRAHQISADDVDNDDHAYHHYCFITYLFLYHLHSICFTARKTKNYIFFYILGCSACVTGNNSVWSLQTEFLFEKIKWKWKRLVLNLYNAGFLGLSIAVCIVGLLLYFNYLPFSTDAAGLAQKSCQYFYTNENNM